MKKKIIIPNDLIPFFRSNHAGETGAVFIYKAILLLNNNKEIIKFSEKHLKTEMKHLELIEEVLDKKHISRLIFFWKIFGFLTGFIPSLFGKKFIYATIFSVESFVESHYQEQIEMLNFRNNSTVLKNFLSKLQEDEISHKEEAFFNAKEFNKLQVLWGSIIKLGSSVAVFISKKI